MTRDLDLDNVKINQHEKYQCQGHRSFSLHFKSCCPETQTLHIGIQTNCFAWTTKVFTKDIGLRKAKKLKRVQ